MTRIQAADLRILLLGLVVLLVAAGATWLGARAMKIDLREVLTAREWKVLLKLSATALMFFALYVRFIYAGLPAEKFIYGRF